MAFIKGQTALDETPFGARFDSEEMTVEFGRGYLVDCYSNAKIGEEEQDFCNCYSNGAFFYVPENIDDSFTVAYGDWFYLEVKNANDSEIYKISKSEREAFLSGGDDPNGGKINPILLWKAPESAEAGGVQIFSDNIFIWDYESRRRYGFSSYKVFETSETIYYKLYGGCVIVPTIGYASFLESLEYSKERDTDKFYYVKVDVLLEEGETDTVYDASLSPIVNFQIVGQSFVGKDEPYSDEELVEFKAHAPGKLSGSYFFQVPIGGNLVLGPSVTTRDRVISANSSEAEVRALRRYKNGVSTSVASLTINPIPEEEQGYYKEIIITRTYPKYKPDGSGGYEPNGSHDIITRYYVEDEAASSDTSPVVLVEITQDPLGDNIIDTGILENDDYELIGGELSEAAYAETRAAVEEIPWTASALWEGEPTPNLLGAGKDGITQKLTAQVIHSERRFQGARVLDVEFSEGFNINGIPENSFSYLRIVDTEGQEEVSRRSVTLDIETLIYIEGSWEPHPLTKDDGVYTIEEILDECQVQEEFGEFASKDITHLVYPWYQQLNLSRI